MRRATSADYRIAVRRAVVRGLAHLLGPAAVCAAFRYATAFRVFYAALGLGFVAVMTCRVRAN